MTRLIDANTCRAQLAKLLGDENTLLLVLEGQLQREHEFLRGNDIDGLEAAGAARQDTVARLLHLDDDRRSLCRMMGMRDSIAGVAELLRWCDENGTLASTYQQCTDLSTRCRDQNDRNGALVTARLNHVSNMLGMLNVGGREGRTYGANATNNAAPALAGRLLATSA